VKIERSEDGKCIVEFERDIRLEFSQAEIAEMVKAMSPLDSIILLRQLTENISVDDLKRIKEVMPALIPGTVAVLSEFVATARRV
jgi:hypothetical protein